MAEEIDLNELGVRLHKAAHDLWFMKDREGSSPEQGRLIDELIDELQTAERLVHDLEASRAKGSGGDE